MPQWHQCSAEAFAEAVSTGIVPRGAEIKINKLGENHPVLGFFQRFDDDLLVFQDENGRGATYWKQIDTILWHPNPEQWEEVEL